MPITKSWTMYLMITAACVGLIGIRGCRAIVPSGAGVIPFCVASVNGPRLVSAAGTVCQVYFHDSGAAHSGNYWTWIVMNNWLLGRRVVSEGYSSWDTRLGERPFPAEFQGKNLIVKYLDGSRSNVEREIVVRVE